MSFVLVFQALTNGLVNGMVYALTAAGFSLIYGHANILFFALGEIYMLGAVLTYVFISNFGIPYFAALGISILILGFFGVFLERFFFRYLEGKDGLVFALASLALAMLISGIALETFGERGKAISAPVKGIINMSGVILPSSKLLIVIISLALLLGLHFFFKLTRSGRAIRAVSQEADAAQLVGVSLNYVKGVTFFLALAIAAGGGGLIAPLYYVDVFMGAPILMTTLIVVVLGGLGSFPGAIAGGLFIGIIESFGYTFLGGITTMVSFFIVIFILIIKPEGLFGHE
jgi:branched-chain amino acid transport system permease protein